MIQIPANLTSFCELINLPLHSKTGLPSKPTSYQLEIDELINIYRFFAINKSKKIGITEGVLLSLAKYILRGKFAGEPQNPGEVMLVAGNRGEHIMGRGDNDLTAVMPRFRLIMEAVDKAIYKRDKIHIIKDSTRKSIRVDINGKICIINAYPSNDSALIGKPNVKCIYLDEAAFTGVTNDVQVYRNLKDNLISSGGNFIITSTPNGRRGFFYKLCEDKPKEWEIIKYDYRRGLEAGIFTQEDIDDQMNDPQVDFRQSFCCDFTSTITSIFLDPQDDEYNKPVRL